MPGNGWVAKVRISEALERYVILMIITETFFCQAESLLSARTAAAAFGHARMASTGTRHKECGEGCHLRHAELSNLQWGSET